MKPFLTTILLLIATTAAVAAVYDPGVIVPTPKKLTPAGRCRLSRQFVITCRQATEKKDAAYLAAEIDRLFGYRPSVSVANAGEAIVLAIDKKLSPPEAYRIAMTPTSVTITGADSDGVFHGIQTLLQILESRHVSLNATQLSFPAANIEDHPDLPWRGQMHQLCFGVDPDDMPSVLQAMARLKFNKVMLEFGPFVRSDSHPDVTAPNAISRAKCREIVALARKLHLEPIPAVNSLGHGDRALRLPDMVKEGVGGSLNIANPDTYKILFDVYTEILEDFGHPRYFQAGMDEVFGNYFPMMVKKLGKPADQVLVDHVVKMNDFFRSKGVTMMIWHDMLVTQKDCPEGAAFGGAPLNTAAAVDKIPKNVVLCYWCYDPFPAYPTLDKLKSKGFTVVGCPWYDTQNISVMSRDSQKADGMMLGTLWTGSQRRFEQDNWSFLGTRYFSRAFALQAECGWNAGADPDKLAYDPQAVVLDQFCGRATRVPGRNAVGVSLPETPSKLDLAERILKPCGITEGSIELRGVSFSIDLKRVPNTLAASDSRIEPNWANVALPLKAVTKAGAECPIDAINTYRDEGQLILYTATRGETTSTNNYGSEVLISDGIVAENRPVGTGDAPIPTGGYVLSAHHMDKPTDANKTIIAFVDALRKGDSIRILDARGNEVLAPTPPATGDPLKLIEIPVGRRASEIILLHALDSFCRRGVEVGSYSFEYADGATETVPLKAGENIAAWRVVKTLQPPTPTAWLAAVGPTCDGVLSALEWRNPHPEKLVKSIRMTPTPTGARKGYLLLAATAIDPARN